MQGDHPPDSIVARHFLSKKRASISMREGEFDRVVRKQLLFSLLEFQAF